MFLASTNIFRFSHHGLGLSQCCYEIFLLLLPLCGIGVGFTWGLRFLNITRGIEIKNKWTVTRGEVGGDNGGERRKGLQEHL